MARPVIAVTTSRRSGWRVFPLVALNVLMAGGRARRWGVDRDARLASVDGLIIGGGDDISPELYGKTLVIGARIDPARDALEHRLAVEALEQGIPVLGICRGAQMLNIALDGTLHEDAWAAHRAGRPMKTILPRRTVSIVEGTHLARHCGTAPMRVNALHTQSMATLGKGLRISARDHSGMVQAIERERDPFAMGVQWHPEHLFYARRQRRIFAALVAAARAHAAGRGQNAEVVATAPVDGG